MAQDHTQHYSTKPQQLTGPDTPEGAEKVQGAAGAF